MDSPVIIETASHRDRSAPPTTEVAHTSDTTLLPPPPPPLQTSRHDKMHKIKTRLRNLGVTGSELENPTLTATCLAQLSRNLQIRGYTETNPLPAEEKCIICKEMKARDSLYYMGNGIGGLGLYGLHKPLPGTHLDTTAVELEVDGGESWDRQTCEHTVCIECMVDYVKHGTSHGRHIIRCPGLCTDGTRPCSNRLYTADVAAFIPTDLFERWTTRTTADYKNRLQTVLGKRKRPDDESSEGGDNSESGRENNDDGGEAKFAQFVHDFCRPCPKCNIIILKSEGCDEMVCTCQTQFCYHCGKEFNGHSSSASCSC